MGQNFKSFRLQACRDRLHLRGKYECTFKQKVELILEILGLVHSPRNQSWCRRYAAELRANTLDPTPEQLTLLSLLDDRIFKKGQLIQARQDKNKAKKKDRVKRNTKPTPTIAPMAPDEHVW